MREMRGEETERERERERERGSSTPHSETTIRDTVKEESCSKGGLQLTLSLVAEVLSFLSIWVPG